MLRSLVPQVRIPAMILNIAIVGSPLLITLLSTTMQVQDYVKSLSLLRAANFISSDNEIFDFIVVGSGSAGAPIASRLSENPNIKVLLIEAGGSPNPLSYIPATAPLVMNHPATDWGYRTVPQNGSALGIKNQQILFPRGKGLGGSSGVNYMMYMKGNKRDYNRWARHTGDDRWNYTNLEKYFDKLEDYFGVWENTKLHKTGGPLRIEPGGFKPGLEHILKAANERGYQIRDPNFDQQEGFAPIDFTTKRGFRYGTYAAYLMHAINRPNLKVYRYTVATKIHFNQFRKAVGVTYYRHGVKAYAGASKEVIVCGGSINSPQLLMLSGIGPSRHLREVGIKPIVDLPVGQNLQDHPLTTVPIILNDTVSFLLERDMTVNQMLNYALKGTGPLSVPVILTGLGLVSTANQPKMWPDIMYFIESVGISPIIMQQLGRTLNSGNLAEYFLKPFFGKDAHLGLISLGLPKSRGYVKLRNRNPFAHPLINPRYFTDPGNEDARRLVEGIQIFLKLYENTTEFQKLGARFPEAKVPGCERFEFRSYEYFECYIRVVTMTLYHPTSTCAMGRRGSPDAVVDSKLRVIGIDGLRVADASVMPFVTNTNTNIPTIVIGEVCADLVKQDWHIT